MALNADTLLDRFYLKAQIRKWQLFSIAAIIIACIVLIESRGNSSPIDRDYIARLSIEGFISDDQKLYELIDDIANDTRAKAVIVWIDSPGGSAVGGEEIYLRLREIAKEKPVVAVMRSIGTSAGYLTALGADHIIARSGTITGSIGVILETAEFSDLIAKMGINPITIKSAPLKGSPSMFEKPTAESKQVLQALIDDFYVHFVDIVAQRRNMPKAKALALADGRVYSGANALKNNLIDAIGGEDEAMGWLVETRQIPPQLSIKDVKIPEEMGFFTQITQSAIGKFLPSSGLGLDGLVSVWHPELH